MTTVTKDSTITKYDTIRQLVPVTIHDTILPDTVFQDVFVLVNGDGGVSSDTSILSNDYATSKAWVKDRLYHELIQNGQVVVMTAEQYVNVVTQITEHYKETNETQVHEITTNELTGWQWFQVWVGRIVLGLVAIIIIIYLIKLNMGGLNIFRKLLTLALLVPFFRMGQYNDTIYIDPTYGSGGDGSYSAPYDSWTDVTSLLQNSTDYLPYGNSPQDSTAFLMKRGTSELVAQINLSYCDDVKVGAYGPGTDMPELICGGAASIFNVNLISTNVVIDSFELHGEMSPSDNIMGAGITMSGTGNVGDPYLNGVTVSNCKIHTGGLGIQFDDRSNGVTNVL